MAVDDLLRESEGTVESGSATNSFNCKADTEQKKTWVTVPSLPWQDNEVG
jgi:hypothetical protein